MLAQTSVRPRWVTLALPDSEDCIGGWIRELDYIDESPRARLSVGPGPLLPLSVIQNSSFAGEHDVRSG